MYSGELYLTAPVVRCTLGVNTLSSSWTGCWAAGSTERWSVYLGVSVVWTSADLLRRRISLSVLPRYNCGCGVFVRIWPRGCWSLTHTSSPCWSGGSSFTWCHKGTSSVVQVHSLHRYHTKYARKTCSQVISVNCLRRPVNKNTVETSRFPGLQVQFPELKH